MKLCHINRRGPVFLRHRVYNNGMALNWQETVWKYTCRPTLFNSANAGLHLLFQLIPVIKLYPVNNYALRGAFGMLFYNEFQFVCFSGCRNIYVEQLARRNHGLSGLDKFNNSVSNMFLLKFCQVNFEWISPCDTETFIVRFYVIIIVLFFNDCYF